MRTIYEIQKDIARVAHELNWLILEKKLTIDALRGIEESSRLLAEHAIEKMMEEK